MRRWLRFAGSAINGTPLLLVVPMMMFCLWAMAAEIYATSVWAHYGGNFAVLGLVGVNVLYAWLLVFGLLVLAHDLRDLCMPKHRQVLAGALAVVVLLILVAPCAFVWLVHGTTHDIVMVAMAAALGTLGALLRRSISRMHRTPAARPAAPVSPSSPMRLPNPRRAVRMALGAPYAPASWQRRLGELALLCVPLAGLPLLVAFLGRSLQPRAFTIVLHVAELASFLAVLVLCWLWPLSRLVAIFNRRNAAQAELALLPSMGNGRQQLRRLFLVALSIPAGCLVVLLGIALLFAALEHLPHGTYVKLAAELILVPMIAVPVLASGIDRSNPRPGAVTGAITTQIWTFTIMIWTIPWEGDNPLVVLVRWLMAGLFLLATLASVGITIYVLRKLLRRPHPFVELAS